MDKDSSTKTYHKKYRDKESLNNVNIMQIKVSPNNTTIITY